MCIPFDKWLSLNAHDFQYSTSFSTLKTEMTAKTTFWICCTNTAGGCVWGCVCTCVTWGSLSLHSCLWRGGMADWAGGQCSPSVLPFTEYSGVLPSVMSRVRNTRNSSVSYSKNSSNVSTQGRKREFEHLWNCFRSMHKNGKNWNLSYWMVYPILTWWTRGCHVSAEVDMAI